MPFVLGRLLIKRRDLLIGAGLVASGLTALAARPPSREGVDTIDLEGALPQTVGAGKADETVDAILAPRDGLSQAVYNQVVVRRYVVADRPAITLVMAYGSAQSYATQIHRPELCYPASGFTTGEPEPLALAIGGREIPANFLIARRGGRTDAVLYYTRLGEKYPRSLFDQRSEIVRAALARRTNDGLLVRLSRSSSDLSDDHTVLSEFAGQLYLSAPIGLRRLMIGK